MCCCVTGLLRLVEWVAVREFLVWSLGLVRIVGKVQALVALMVGVWLLLKSMW